MKRPERRGISTQIRGRGLKVTPQRYAILELLASHPGHPTADEVFREVNARFPLASRATVYNTMAALEEAGLVTALYFEDGVARYDANRDAHHHFVCRGCRRILDVPARMVRSRVDLRGDHQMESCEIIMRGLCADCK